MLENISDAIAVNANRDENPAKEKKPCYEISYIKVTYDKDGKVESVTVKVSKAQQSGK